MKLKKSKQQWCALRMHNCAEKYRHATATRGYLRVPADPVWAHWANILRGISIRAKHRSETYSIHLPSE